MYYPSIHLRIWNNTSVVPAHAVSMPQQEDEMDFA